METVTRSQINKWKSEYGDTLENGIILSEYDIHVMWGDLDNVTIIEDVEEKN